MATCVAPRLVSVTTSRDQQPELDAHTGESDSLPPRFCARRHVVVPRQLLSLHAAPIVHDRQRRVGRIGQQLDARRTGVERIGDDFGENRLLGLAGICVPQVLKKVLEIDSGFAHAAILV